MSFEAVRARLLKNICELESQQTRDVMYRLIADGGHFGSRCNKRSCTKGMCDLCWYMLDKQVPESTHHWSANCPYSEMVTVGALRGLIQATGSAHTHTFLKRLPTPTIAQAFRLALQTGFRHKGLAPLGGDELLMTETNNEVWRELIGAVMTVLERRRNRNAYFAMPIAYDADDAYRDALRLLRTNALAIRPKRLRETERIKIHFNNWEPEEGTPLDKWRSIWVESGVAEELPGRNNLKLLLPKSLKDIEGALHNIDDIRSTPHGNSCMHDF